MSKNPCRLLLIEPDPGDAELASRILTQTLEGCQVCIAPDAISYAKHFAVGGFSTVISELELGWSSGTEILASFAQRHPGTRLILFTSKLPPDIERLRKKIGLAGYAEKSSTGFLRLPDLANAVPEDEPSHEGGEILWTQTIEQLEEPSLTVMKDGRILEANRAAARVFGYPKPDDLLGLRLSGLFDSPRHSIPGEDELFRQLRTLGLEGVKRLELMAAPAEDPLRVGRKRLVGWPIPNSPRIAVIYHTLAHADTEISSAENGEHQQAYTQLLLCPLLVVLENLIRFSGFLELLLCTAVAGILVGMELDSELPIRLLDLFGTG